MSQTWAKYISKSLEKEATRNLLKCILPKTALKFNVS